MIFNMVKSVLKTIESNFRKKPLIKNYVDRGYAEYLQAVDETYHNKYWLSKQTFTDKLIETYAYVELPRIVRTVDNIHKAIDTYIKKTEPLLKNTLFIIEPIYNAMQRNEVSSLYRLRNRIPKSVLLPGIDIGSDLSFTRAVPLANKGVMEYTDFITGIITKMNNISNRLPQLDRLVRMKESLPIQEEPLMSEIYLRLQMLIDSMLNKHSDNIHTVGNAVIDIADYIEKSIE